MTYVRPEEKNTNGDRSRKEDRNKLDRKKIIVQKIQKRERKARLQAKNNKLYEKEKTKTLNVGQIRKSKSRISLKKSPFKKRNNKIKLK